MTRKNKNQVYLLVTIAYAILCMFVIGSEETNPPLRFLIVCLWSLVMIITASIIESITF